MPAPRNNAPSAATAQRAVDALAGDSRVAQASRSGATTIIFVVVMLLLYDMVLRPNRSQGAMTATRSMVRSDLVRLFDDPGNLNVEKFVDVWYSESSQAALRNLVQRLQKK